MATDRFPSGLFTGDSAGSSTEVRQKIIKMVEQIQKADYEGDRTALKQLYEQLSPYTEDKDIGSRVRYWRGFALWRRALNGFNESVDPKELEQDIMYAKRSRKTLALWTRKSARFPAWAV